MCERLLRTGGLLFFICCSFFACQKDQPDPVVVKVEPKLQVDRLNTWEAQLDAISKALATAGEQPSDIREAQLKLKKLADDLPELQPILRLKIAELGVMLGEIQKAVDDVVPLLDGEQVIAQRARHFIIRHSGRCHIIARAIQELPSTSTDPFDLISHVQYQTRCGEKKSRLTRALLRLARYAPQKLSSAEVITLGASLNIEKVIPFIKDLEQARAPQAAIRVLDRVLRREGLDESTVWSLRFQRARVRVDRLREGYKKAIKELKRLVNAPKSKGRTARLLLGKAFEKDGQPKQAQRTYRGLIREWTHSVEAKEARFRLAFIDYEQKNYKKAVSGLAPLCRHRGEVAQLSRLVGRAERKSIHAKAEWYFAWSLYLRRPEEAAPFLEAQIGRGLPLSQEGRRAAYWAAKAYAHSNPERSAELRSQLLQGHWGDWYSLLLRASDPSIAEDIDAWPNLPPLESPQIDRSPVISSDGGVPSLPRPRLEPPKATGSQEIQEYQEQLARWIRLIQLAETLQDEWLSRAWMNLAKVKLSEMEKQGIDVGPWGRTLRLFRSLNRWSLSSHPRRLRSAPLLSDETWWRNVFPLAFRVEVETASHMSGVEQTTIWSFIYKESAFYPRAISPAYAMGLMQLLEKTAQALHPEKPSPNLLNPAINVQLGAEYLAALSRRFHDQLPLIAAAYNAGPQHVVSWTRNGDRKLDLFVERIPFKEAREYVKRLVMLRCIYSLLYGQRSINQCAAELPLTLNLMVADGVNF